MNKSFGASDPKLTEYAERVFEPEDAILKEVRSRSAREGLPEIQVGPMDALHLEVLTRALNAKKAVEIGTLGGYSGIAITRGMGPQGKLFTFDIESKHTDVARRSFELAGLSRQVEFFTGAATELLPSINNQGPFDLVFIDADKNNYPAYLAWAAENLRVGGVVLGDNTFGWGMITDERFESAEDEVAIRGLQTFNHICARGGRFRSTILPTGEGLTLAVKTR